MLMTRVCGALLCIFNANSSGEHGDNVFYACYAVVEEGAFWKIVFGPARARGFSKMFEKAARIVPRA